jgi:hypothetical protein
MLPRKRSRRIANELDQAVAWQGVREDRQRMRRLIDGVRHVVQGGREAQDVRTSFA